MDHNRPERENSQLLLQVQEERNALSNQRKPRQGVIRLRKACEYKITAVVLWMNTQESWEQHKSWCLRSNHATIFPQRKQSYAANSSYAESLILTWRKTIRLFVFPYLNVLTFILISHQSKRHKRFYILSYHSVFWVNLTITLNGRNYICIYAEN